MNTDKIIASVSDLSALLEHYASGRPDNWDGTTKRQALVAIREAKALIAELREEQKENVNGI